MTAVPTMLPVSARKALRRLGVRLDRRLPDAPAGSVSYRGIYRQQPVLATVRVSDDPAVLACQRLEQSLHWLAAYGQSPLPLPPAFYLDEHLTIVSSGHRSGEQSTVTEAALRDLLDRLDCLHRWTVPPTLRTPAPPVGDLLTTYLRRGVLRPSSVAAMRGILGVNARQRLELGDLRPAAFRFDPTALIAVSGPLRLQHRLAGSDWAHLHLRFADVHPWLAGDLIGRAERDGIAATYASVLVLTACRQWTSAVGPDRKAKAHARVDAAQKHLYRLYQAFL